MAIDTSAGTETLHTILLEDVANSAKTLITGEQHHIYTVLSISLYFVGAPTGEDFTVYLTGYDSAAGTSAQTINLMYIRDPAVRSTFVWNDKFSFNGYEPSSNTQSARSAQAGSVAQSLNVVSTNASFIADITCTFIDQNNA